MARAGWIDRSETPRTRIVATDDGRIWRVEQLAPRPGDAYGEPSLVFTTENLMRRLRSFPENWYELSDSELAALSMRP